MKWPGKSNMYVTANTLKTFMKIFIDFLLKLTAENR